MKRMSMVTSFALVAVIELTGCAQAQSGAGMKEIHWQEQVRLTTGEVIVVERGEKLRRVGQGFENGWLFDEGWLKAKLPGVGETRWEGTISPLVLDVTSKGKWYLLGITTAYRGHEDYKLPEHKRYVAFTLTGGAWQRVPFTEFPPEFQPNLLGNANRLFIIEGTPRGTMVGFEAKKRVDSITWIAPEFLRINRSLGE